MPPKKVYCSIGKIPSGQRLGTMKECADLKQIRYYGVKKIDPKLLEAIKKNSVKKESRDKLAIQMAMMRGRVSGYNKKISAEKDKDKKAKLQEDLEKAKNELAIAIKKFKQADDARAKSKGGSRKGSRKSRSGSRSKSRSRSRKLSRGGSKRKSRKGSRRSGSKKRRSRRRSKSI
jgi:hypothetical protein